MDNWIVVLNDGETYTDVRGTLLLRVSDTDLDRLAGGELIADIEPLQRVSIERLRDERDEARRRVCEDAIRNGRVYRRVGRDTVPCETAKEVAEMMGWDCFKENT